MRLAPRHWREIFAEIRRDLVTIQAKIVIGSLCALSDRSLGHLDLLPCWCPTDSRLPDCLKSMCLVCQQNRQQTR